MKSATIVKEMDLYPFLLEFKNTQWHNLKVAKEVASGFGIADLVFYELENRVLEERKSSGIKDIPDNLIEIVTNISQLSKEESFSLTLLKHKVCSLKNNTQEYLSFLIDHNFIVPVDKKKDLYKVGIQYNIGLKNVISIEAKLKNWQRGLFQAYRYKAFSKRSYLALYSKYIKSAYNHKDEFERLNVGLIEVNDQFTRILIEPKEEDIEQNLFSAFAFEDILRG